MSTIPAALDFDFTPILTALDPHHTYYATKLSGGLVNLTARITISKKPESDEEEHACLFGGMASVVAKYAPPYVAALGEEALFSQYRQIIEGRALKLLAEPDTRAYIHALDHGVTSPTLIHHDPIAHVLIMQDLGDAPTLDRWLHTNPSVGLAQAVGERFGMFFARLGGLEDVSGEGLEERFKNPDKDAFVFRRVVRAVRGNLAWCGVDEREAEELTEASVRMHVQAGDGDGQGGVERVFGLGDCWSRSLLVGTTNAALDKQKSEEGTISPGLAVVDWEFAGMTQPLADIGQLSADLYLLHQTSPSQSQPSIQAFALALLRAHKVHAPEWYYAHRHRVSAWRVFGREIVNNVAEFDWFEADEKRKELRGRELGRNGATFMKTADEIEGDGGEGGGVLFEDVFSAL